VERLNRTLQDRLVKELTLHGIGTLEGANAYLRDHFIPAYDGVRFIIRATAPHRMRMNGLLSIHGSTWTRP
jgi:hypothetical protein